MKVLVCGGAGYIGSNMVALLADQGHTPVVYDNLSKGHRTALGQAQLIEGDLADYDRLVQTMKDHQIEAVILEFTKAFLSVVGSGDMVAIVLKVIFQGLNDQPFVLY